MKKIEEVRNSIKKIEDEIKGLHSVASNDPEILFDEKREPELRKLAKDRACKAEELEMLNELVESLIEEDFKEQRNELVQRLNKYNEDFNNDLDNKTDIVLKNIEILINSLNELHNMPDERVQFLKNEDNKLLLTSDEIAIFLMKPSFITPENFKTRWDHTVDCISQKGCMKTVKNLVLRPKVVKL